MVEITLEFSDEEYRLLKELSSKHTITIEEFAKTTALNAIGNDEKFQEFRIFQAKPLLPAAVVCTNNPSSIKRASLLGS